MVYIINWFKSKVHTAIACEISEKGKDYSNTNRIDTYWYLPRHKRPKYPELPQSTYKDQYEYSRHSENSWNLANYLGIATA